MSDYSEIVRFYYTISNLTIATGMFSVGIAIIVSIYKGTAQYKLLSVLIAGLVGFAALGRVLKILDHTGVPPLPELTIDLLTALFAIAAGLIIWPVLSKSIAVPTYSQLEDSNERLNYYKHLFESFMEHSPAVALLKDASSKTLYVNHAFEQAFNVKRQDIVGKADLEWMARESAEEIRKNDRQVFIDQKALSTVEYMHGKDGSSEPWLVAKFPVSGNGAGQAAIGVIGINISAKWEKDKLYAQLAAIVESSHDAIIGQNLEGIITSWNRGAEELYGYSAEEVLGKSTAILTPAERAEELTMIMDKVRRAIRIDNFQTVGVCKQGELKLVSISVSPMRNPDGQIDGAAVIARDISNEKRQESEIRELNKQLKDRIYELAEANGALQSARDQALEASNLKSAFCANISHEIRTPLSGILGLNELLLENGNLNSDDRPLAVMVQDSAQALLQVVNDILDLSKIEAGKITLEYAPFNPVFLLQDCARLMAPSAHNKGLDYTLEMDQKIPEMVYGDVSRLRQVLLNLIGNAIKFTEKGSIRLSARAVDLTDESTRIEFSIKDTGIGIAPEDQRFLFLPFAQVDNSNTRRFGGTGLGLAISKQFLNMMDANIRVESEKGSGSTFTIVVPFDRKKLHQAVDFSTEKMIKPGVEPIPRKVAFGRRILVVEDNPTLQHLALRQLSSLGIDAEATVFGGEAVKLASTGRFDLVLMDVNLPDISGLEATAAIRSSERISGQAELPIIAMTAGAMTGDRERALACGMNDYLAKPVAIEHLKRVVELWLKKSPNKSSLNS